MFVIVQVRAEPVQSLIRRLVKRVSLCVRSSHTSIANEGVMQCLPKSVVGCFTSSPVSHLLTRFHFLQSSSKGKTAPSAFGVRLLADAESLASVTAALEANAGACLFDMLSFCVFV
jgi:hypothetical protein